MEPRFAHGIVINLDRSPGRMDHFRENTAPLFERVTRISAVDKNDMTDAAILDFQQRSNAVREEHPEMNIAPRVSKDFWAGALAVYLSHLHAIETGIMLGGDFMVLEDDATPRLQLLEATPAPPPGQVAVWGGALKGGSYGSHHKAHDKWKSTGGPNPWSSLPQTAPGVRNRHLATAYELPESLAPAWLASVAEHPLALDVSWGFAMLQVPTAVPAIEVFPQKLALGSDRSAAGATAARRYQYLEK